MIPVEKEGTFQRVPIPVFEKMTGVSFIPQLDFENFSLLSDVIRRSEILYQKGELSKEQLWLGSYFRKEVLSPFIPDVVVRYIDPIVGWGVFAARDFKKMEFIAEYTGKLRKRRRIDKKNAYCFEYVSASGYGTPYTIDARDQGGISRYINHSFTPNLLSTLATIDHINHVILIVNEPISKGDQLFFDYGPDYWAARTTPLIIE